MSTNKVPLRARVYGALARLFDKAYRKMNRMQQDALYGVRDSQFYAQKTVVGPNMAMKPIGSTALHSSADIKTVVSSDMAMKTVVSQQPAIGTLSKTPLQEPSSDTPHKFKKMPEEELVARIIEEYGQFSQDILVYKFLPLHWEDLVQAFGVGQDGMVNIPNLIQTALSMEKKGTLHQIGHDAWIMSGQASADIRDANASVLANMSTIMRQTTTPHTEPPREEHMRTVVAGGDLVVPNIGDQVAVQFDRRGRAIAMEYDIDGAGLDTPASGWTHVDNPVEEQNITWLTKMWVSEAKKILDKKQPAGVLTRGEVEHLLRIWMNDHVRLMPKQDRSALETLLIDVAPQHMLTPFMFIHREVKEATVSGQQAASMRGDRYSRYGMMIRNALRLGARIPRPVLRAVLREMMRTNETVKELEKKLATGAAKEADLAEENLILERLGEVLWDCGVIPDGITPDLTGKEQLEDIEKCRKAYSTVLQTFGISNRDDFMISFGVGKPKPSTGDSVIIMRDVFAEAMRKEQEH